MKNFLEGAAFMLIVMVTAYYAFDIVFDLGRLHAVLTLPRCQQH